MCTHTDLDTGIQVYHCMNIFCFHTYACLPFRMASSNVTDGLDQTQVKLLEEECILIDNDDKNIGTASKKVCHLLENINKGIYNS